MVSLNIRSVSEISDHSHAFSGGTTSGGGALAANTVGTSQLTTDAVTAAKIFAGAVTTAKVADDAITLTKLSEDPRTGLYVGDETEVFRVGTVEDTIKTFNFTKDSASAGLQVKKFRVKSKVRSSSGAATASLKVYVDGVLKLTLSTVATTFTLLGGVVDVSAEADGSHLVEIKLVNSAVGETSFNSHIEFFGVQVA